MKKSIIFILLTVLILGIFTACNGDVFPDMFGFTITFDANGGQGKMEPQKMSTSGGELNPNTFTRDGYVFSNWNTAKDGSGTAYSDEAEVKFEGNTTLYAQWIEELTITFNANDGSEPPETKTQKVGKGIATALDANTFELSGFTFTKWNNEKDGSGTDYANGAVKTFDSDLELYAQWAANTDTPYVVNHYTKNLSDDKYTLSSTDNNTDTTGVLLSLANLKETIEGFTYSEGFEGTETKGTTKPSSSEAVTEAEVLGEGNLVIDLYYSRDSHTVALTKGTEADHISAITGADTYAYGASVSVEATIDSGYKLANWIVTGETTEVSTDNPYVFTMGASDVAYTANATPISYTVAFNKNNESATGEMTNQSFTYGTAQNLTENGFQYEGKYFGGWATTTSGEKAYSDKQSVNNLTTTDGDTVTLYAIWTDTPPITIIENTEGTLTLTSGDYTIASNAVTTVTGRITIEGTVNLYLPDDSTLNAESGITVSTGNTLVIDKYGSTATGTGTLTANSGNFAAGIGGEDGGSGGTVIINGGFVNANGGYGAAGIGGGYHGAGGPVNISGGTVTAYGGDNAAGIGGGSSGAGGNVTIKGGTVTAYGGEDGGTGGDAGAGIGGGCNGAGGTVTIEGGTVTATGGSGDMEADGTEAGAGIGGGYKGAGGTVTIKGGTVTATGGKGNKATSGSGAGIGAGEDCSSHGTLKIGTGYVLTGGSASADTLLLGPVDSETTTTYTGDSHPRYMNVSTVSEIKDSDSAITLKSGVYITDKTNTEVTVSERITVEGSVLLLLLDGKTLTASKGITVSTGNSLTIGGTGTLNVTAPDAGNAGIGGGDSGAGGTVTITGGTVNATGGFRAAGIGGGDSGAGGTVTINGGDVEATGGDFAAGIGGGNLGAGGTVTINGGIVIATGGTAGAGIGGGYEGAGGTVTINGGTVTATGDLEAAGIGGGAQGAGGTVTISGGALTANGGNDGAAGIGGGAQGAGGTVTITGGTVTANGGEDAAGIGAGRDSSNHENLTLTGVSMEVSEDNTSWTDYDGSTRKRYMKTK